MHACICASVSGASHPPDDLGLRRQRGGHIQHGAQARIVACQAAHCVPGLPGVACFGHQACDAAAPAISNSSWVVKLQPARIPRKTLNPAGKNPYILGPAKTALSKSCMQSCHTAACCAQHLTGVDQCTMQGKHSKRCGRLPPSTLELRIRRQSTCCGPCVLGRRAAVLLRLIIRRAQRQAQPHCHRAQAEQELHRQAVVKSTFRR